MVCGRSVSRGSAKRAAAPSAPAGCGHGYGRCRRPWPVGSLGLDVDLPGAAEQIEVVDVEAAENGLERVEHVADADAQGLHLVAVDVEIELGRVGGVGGEHRPERRVLVGGEDEPASGCGELGRIAARRSWSWYSKPLPVPSPMIGGRLKAITLASRTAWNSPRSLASRLSTLSAGS